MNPPTAHTFAVMAVRAYISCRFGVCRRLNLSLGLQDDHRKSFYKTAAVSVEQFGG